MSALATEVDYAKQIASVVTQIRRSDWQSLPEAEKTKLLKRLEALRDRQKLYTSLAPAVRDKYLRASMELGPYVEVTSALSLDPWQRVLTARLEKLPEQSGQKILIHAPPQAGKSIIVSQRFPSWYLGRRPLDRIRLACYNITKSSQFGNVNLNVMRSQMYHNIFPSDDVTVGNRVPAGEWSTQARLGLGEAQSSFLALGLQTGFVGQGADLLIIDDPYSSVAEAYSETTRGNVWQFWEATAKPRLIGQDGREPNVVVMFHRYVEDDLAGKLWREGGWEMWRFCAEADGDEEWPDPMGREVGELLSPRMNREHIEEQKKNHFIFYGQFQGRPTALGGGLLKGSYFTKVTADFVPHLISFVCGWDPAVSAKTTADFTVAFPLGMDVKGRYYLFDPARGQWTPGDARINISAYLRKLIHKGRMVSCIGMESVASQSGYVTEARESKLFMGFPILDIPRFTDKVALCAGWQPTAASQGISLVEDGSGWTDTFIREAEYFPSGEHDDQIDAVGLSFETMRRVPNSASKAVGYEDESRIVFGNSDVNGIVARDTGMGQVMTNLGDGITEPFDFERMAANY